MLAPSLKSRALVQVKLSDVPLKIRERHGRRLVDHAAKDGDIQLAAAIWHAVNHPSDRVYWVLREHADRVLG